MEHVPLKKLVLSAQNVRTNVEDATDIAGLVALFETIHSNSKQSEVRSIAHRICAGEVDPKISAMDATELVAAQAWVPAWLRFKDEQPQ
jgi:hypothetical protein